MLVENPPMPDRGTLCFFRKDSRSPHVLYVAHSIALHYARPSSGLRTGCRSVAWTLKGCFCAGARKVGFGAGGRQTGVCLCIDGKDAWCPRVRYCHRGPGSAQSTSVGGSLRCSMVFTWVQNPPERSMQPAFIQAAPLLHFPCYPGTLGDG